MSIHVTNRFGEAARALENAGPQALSIIALFVVGEAKRRCPVDTGYLRGSIGYTIIHTGNRYVLRIYTNVEYAKFVHEGTRRMQGRPFIRNAIEQNQSRIKQLVAQAYARGLN